MQRSRVCLARSCCTEPQGTYRPPRLGALLLRGAEWGAALSSAFGGAILGTYFKAQLVLEELAHGFVSGTQK